MKRIGVLALQGAFIEHERMLAGLGAETKEIRNLMDFGDIGGLVLPGGESTVMEKLLVKTGLLAPVKQAVEGGLPVLGTCAGLILLSETVIESPENGKYEDTADEHSGTIGTLPVRTRRNAYGRQTGSSVRNVKIKGTGDFPVVLIRGPWIESAGSGVEVIAEDEGHILGVKYENQIGLAFHPELSGNPALHEAFLQMVQRSQDRPR